jgi:hypothetical protein
MLTSREFTSGSVDNPIIWLTNSTSNEKFIESWLSGSKKGKINPGNNCPGAVCRILLSNRLESFPLLSKAVLTVNWTVSYRFKRNHCFSSTGSTYRRVHFPRYSTISTMSCLSTRLAALGLIFKALLCVKLLFACRENEFLTAVLAH